MDLQKRQSLERGAAELLLRNVKSPEDVNLIRYSVKDYNEDGCKMPESFKKRLSFFTTNYWK